MAAGEDTLAAAGTKLLVTVPMLVLEEHPPVGRRGGKGTMVAISSGDSDGDGWMVIG
jgi:hypothetical protein